MLARFSVVLMALMVAARGPIHTATNQCETELSSLVGWTIIDTDQVDGEFEGCDFDKRIHLIGGATYTCAMYNYSYAYMPEAIVFAKRYEYQGRPYLAIKLLIEGEIYEMEPRPTG
jgi:hypothetical protein